LNPGAISSFDLTGTFRVQCRHFLCIGALIKRSALSAYKWEKGEVRPSDKHIAAIALLRTMGKKEAAAKLSQLLA
jgi:hypothetical protein